MDRGWENYKDVEDRPLKANPDWSALSDPHRGSHTVCLHDHSIQIWI